ncbi:hypothetical protein Marky_0261 [Marinithermus hydrothermalis DSM 14884]|uniref:Uncharacterized protein n=1 Tax=Marinithermus hydrothermalis (strain DSM 14884 / JCM 11576 / T1) TaxID=869210 RepID=F2NNK7_MARHT|nr:hypothetical protein Marky_0261 [Marinithermus hydrothermalis DSM 14884]
MTVRLDFGTRAVLWTLIGVAMLSLIASLWPRSGPSTTVRPQDLAMRRGEAVAVSTSQDGRVVYLSDGVRVYRSTAYGDEGTWKLIAEAASR